MLNVGKAKDMGDEADVFAMNGDQWWQIIIKKTCIN